MVEMAKFKELAPSERKLPKPNSKDAKQFESLWAPYKKCNF
jgi:hypothetical protein